VRFSRALIVTKKQAPKDATLASHRLLLRAGALRSAGAGIYELLPLGRRLLHKIETATRQEMENAGLLEVALPTLSPASYLRESKRWEAFGSTLFRFRDRRGIDHHLSPTHEEGAVAMFRAEVRSYRDLPINLFQMQKVFRDEPRPRGGLLRCREFVMADSYSFDADEARAGETYAQMRQMYERLLRRLGVRFHLVHADSGAMGGRISAEFQLPCESGEDSIAICDHCGYTANLEVAATRAPTPLEPTGAAAPLREIRSEARTVQDLLTADSQLQASGVLKSIVYMADGRPVLAVLRGDHSLVESKLQRELNASQVRLATEAEIREHYAAAPGFVGPVNFDGRIVADLGIAELEAAVTGCNRDGFHVAGARLGRDFGAELVDLRKVEDGDRCASCDSHVRVRRAIEAAHIFQLGTRYSEPMKAWFVDQSGKRRVPVMGCTGIGLTRLIAAIVEQRHDERGPLWPASVAPYRVSLCPVEDDAAVIAAADRLYERLQRRAIDVLYDDRPLAVGVKLADADLIGTSLRILVSLASIGRGAVQLRTRSQTDGAQEVAADACAERVATMLAEADALAS
jgi:prolyl-tRNA synthetase